MAQIELPDHIIEAARKRAIDVGFANVEQYVAEVLVQDLAAVDDNFDHLFTPERIAELEKISAEIKAGGKTYTMAEVEEYVEQTRKEWLANHPS